MSDPDARYEISRAIGNALRDEFRELIRQERVERQDALESLRRTLDARTERFA